MNILFTILLLAHGALPVPHYLTLHDHAVRILLNGLPHEVNWMMGVTVPQATGGVSQVIVQQGTPGPKAKPWPAIRIAEGIVDIGQLSSIHGGTLMIDLNVPADTIVSVEGNGRELFKETLHDRMMVVNGRAIPVSR